MFKLVYIEINIHIRFYRNADRLIHVPFFKVEMETNYNHQKMEEKLKKAMEVASSSVGIIIKYGETFKSPEFQQKIQQYISVVEEALPSSHYRVIKSYSLMLATTEQVGHHKITTL